MRQGVLSTLTACKGTAISCRRNSLNKSTNAQESCKVAATSVLQKVCSLALFTTCYLAIGDLAIGCLGVQAIESEDDEEEEGCEK